MSDRFSGVYAEQGLLIQIPPMVWQSDARSEPRAIAAP